jgi:aminopeptidase N
MMSSWTTQMGFPLVTVADAQWEDGAGWVLTVTQRWFLADGSEGT